jgi:hypothetical protein
MADSTCPEEWRLILGFEEYMVSNLGQVLSTKFGKKRIIRSSPDGSGYLQVHFYSGGVQAMKKSSSPGSDCIFRTASRRNAGAS